MRILQVMAGAQYGGAETAFVDMCLAMHNAGEHIEVITRANKLRISQLESAGIHVHILPFGSKLDVLTSWKMARIIRAFKPDIVQTWMSRAAAKTPQWKPFLGIPRYFNVARLGTPYKMKYFKNSDYFISITPDIRDYIISHNVETKHVRHINNFAEVEKVTDHINREDMNTPENAILLLGLGRLHPDKAFDTLIKAVAELPDTYLWIAGEGSQRAELEQLIIELNTQERIKLLGWRTDRAALLQACDICAFTSREEGFGTVFVQAWAQRTPVLVSDADGPRQFVRHEEDGIITPVDDKEAIKSAITRMSKDKALCDKLIENGYKRYENEFTKEKTLQSYLSWYQEIIEMNL